MPCDHDVHCVAAAEGFTWQETQSVRAGPRVWSNARPPAMLELADVRTALGLELAWQSTQEAGCGTSPVVNDAWKRAGVVPA